MVNESISKELLADLADRKKRILNCAEAALGSSQFSAFRRIFLDEFGDSGFESKLKLTILEMERNGMGRNIYAGEEVPE